MIEPFSIIYDRSSRFPIQLKILFSLKRVKDVKAFISANTLTLEELSRAVYSAHLEGYRHSLRNIEHMPEFLQGRSDELRTHLREGNGKKVCGLIGAMFDQRKISVTHLFLKENMWHIIYFSQNDIETNERNHWKFGSHVHFVNYLWNQYTIQDVWEILSGRQHGSLGEHYRFKESRPKG